MFVEQLDQLGKVSEGAGKPVDLIDDDDVDLASTDIVHELLKGRALGRST